MLHPFAVFHFFIVLAKIALLVVNQNFIIWKNQAKSKRSAFITLFQAATKSITNFS